MKRIITLHTSYLGLRAPNCAYVYALAHQLSEYIYASGLEPFAYSVDNLVICQIMRTENGLKCEAHFRPFAKLVCQLVLL
jgi:hypothetical protein